MSEDTYLSHPVRRMREDPIEGEETTLVVRVAAESENHDDDSLDRIEAAIEDAGGSVTKRLEFGTLLVEVEQERIDDLSSVSGIASIETDNTIRMAGDAGEDV